MRMGLHPTDEADPGPMVCIGRKPSLSDTFGSTETGQQGGYPCRDARTLCYS